MHSFGGHERKTVGQIEAQLAAETLRVPGPVRSAFRAPFWRVSRRSAEYWASAAKEVGTVTAQSYAAKPG
jgi:hypothetical protein